MVELLHSAITSLTNKQLLFLKFIILKGLFCSGPNFDPTFNRSILDEGETLCSLMYSKEMLVHSVVFY